MQPRRDLPAAPGDEARAGVIVAEQVVPKRHPVLGVRHAVVQELAHEQGTLARISIRDERGDTVGVRQQADQVEARAPDEGVIVAAWGGGVAAGRLVGVHDPIDGIGAAVERRRQGHGGKLQGRLPRGAGEREALLPRGPFVDPPPQDGDRCVGQRGPVARHPQVGVVARDAGDQLTSGGVARDDPGGARVTAGDERLAGVHREPALPSVAEVTLGAVPLEDRHHFVHEIHRLTRDTTCRPRQKRREEDRSRLSDGTPRHSDRSCRQTDLRPGSCRESRAEWRPICR